MRARGRPRRGRGACAARLLGLEYASCELRAVRLAGARVLAGAAVVVERRHGDRRAAALAAGAACRGRCSTSSSANAPTSPLYGKDADDPPLLSEPWWALFEGVCCDASELGVRLWFYDQIPGSPGRTRVQVVRERPGVGGALAEDRRRMPGGRTPLAELDGWLYYTVSRGFDHFSPEACARLFAMVHGRFEEHVGEWFGSTIAGSFQDERSTSRPGAGLRRAVFLAGGLRPAPAPAALFEEDGEGFRTGGHPARGALGEAAFFRPLHEWHERHGLLCGVDQQYGARVVTTRGSSI